MIVLRPVRLVVTILAVCASGATSFSLQSPQAPTFRASVELVRVDVAVRRGGRPVASLSTTDFEILDNGVRQTIEQALTEDLPLEAWLVLDVSGSLRGRPLLDLQEAASSFAGALLPRDYAGLVTFSHEVLVPQQLTQNVSAMQAALGRLRASGGTALYDAAYVATQLRNPGGTRGVAVVLTDGADNASWLTAERVLEAARRSDLVIYGIGVSEEPASPGSRQTGESQGLVRALAPVPRAFADLPQYRFLRGLAAATGGQVFNASFGTLRETLSGVLGDIRARYLLTYNPTNVTPGWHTLEVKLTRSRGDVTARRGYWVAPRQPGSKTP